MHQRQRGRERPPMTARDIELALTRPFAVFDRRRYLCVPNVSWGLGLAHECDLLALTAAGYAHEIEIKVSLYDLKRDAGKGHNHSSSIIKCLWFAGPEKLGPALLLHAPADAGVIVVADAGADYSVRVLREAVPRPCQPFTAHRRYQLARLGCIRYWDAREHLDRLQKEASRARTHP